MYRLKITCGKLTKELRKYGKFTAKTYLYHTSNITDAIPIYVAIGRHICEQVPV